MKLEGKVAIVTGGASGLGLSTVEYLIKRGCKVVIVDLNDKAGEELSQQIG